MTISWEEIKALLLQAVAGDDLFHTAGGLVEVLGGALGLAGGGSGLGAGLLGRK